MDEYEAIARLQDHFRIHDDGRPTPVLDEAVEMAYVALANQKWLREELAEYYENPTPAKGAEIAWKSVEKIAPHVPMID